MWSGGSVTAVFCNCKRRLMRIRALGIMGFCLVVLILPHPAGAADRLYYFWSFSMPEDSIKAAFTDGEKIGLVAVLRGLPEGSARESLLRLKRLLGERKVEVVIDPLLFRLYGIADAVPAIVYAEGVNPTCEHCEPAPRYWKAVGDISVETALENLHQQTPSAERYLKKIREGFYSR